MTKCGVYKYAQAPDFEVLLFAYSFDGGEVRVIDIASGEQLPDEIHRALTDDTIIKWAFNAQFERVCLSHHLGEWLKPDSWRCTMVWSAYMGLPLSLEGVGAVLGLEKQKLKEGKELIRYFSMPCKATKNNGGRTRNLPIHDPDRWEQFKAYNCRDVETEMVIQQKLSKFPVPEDEWCNFILDQEINDRGILLDMDLVREAIRMDNRARYELTAMMRELTNLENPNSVVQLKGWFAEKGFEMDSLDKAAVKELLEVVPEPLERVLELRQSLSKSSVRKYAAMENAVCSDGRARGLLQFYGANRTGRFAGRLIQVQNLPQNRLPDLRQARALVKSGDFEVVEALYDSVPAGLAEEELHPLVMAWRQANPNIVRFWWAVDKAAMTAVRERTRTVTHGIRFDCRSGMLFITLPSGRQLAYVKPRIGLNRFGNDAVSYEGTGNTKKWERIETYGAKLVENIVQAISRDILCHAMRRLDSLGFSIVMSVHDEVVIEATRDVALDTICSYISEIPPWAPGLILRADGFECDFYKKD